MLICDDGWGKEGRSQISFRCMSSGAGSHSHVVPCVCMQERQDLKTSRSCLLLSKQCDVCEGETCELSTLDRLPSTHADSQARELYDSDQYFSTDDAPHYPNNSAAWEPLQAIDTSTSAMLLSSVKDQSYNAFWPADYTQALILSPQLQLALPRKVSDTAQSIEFARKGNIDCLKAQFSLGLASPRDESHSRGWTLLKVSITTLSSLVTLSIAPE